MGQKGKRECSRWKDWFVLDEDSKRILFRVIFFPAVLFYLELILHLFMGMDLQYIPIYLLCGSAVGFLLAALSVPFSERGNHVITKAVTGLLCLLFAVEFIAKKILQSYYPFSTLGVAAGNRLSDYADVIGSTVVASIPILLLFFLPLILLWFFGRKYMGYEPTDRSFSAVLLAGVVVLHLFGVGSVYLSWEGDLTPQQLYHMDTNIDDQVEQLGLINMLRLDLKHLIVPPEGDLDTDFSGLEGLGDSSSQESFETGASEVLPGGGGFGGNSERTDDRHVSECDGCGLESSCRWNLGEKHPVAGQLF